MPRVLLVLGLFCWAPSAAWAEFYKYVDADGNEAFTNDFDKLPKRWQDHYEKLGKKPASAPAEPAPGPKPASKEDPSRYERERRARMDERLQASQSKRGDADRVTLEWQRRKWRAEDRLEALKKEHQQAKELAGKITWLSPRQQNGSLSHQNELRRLQALERAKRLEKEIASVERELAVDIPEGARRAGVAPGAMREPRPQKKKGEAPRTERGSSS